MTTFGAVVRRGGGWLPLIAVAALVDSGCVLALPTVLGRIVDLVVTGRDSTRWIVLAGGLVAAGIAADLIDTFAGAACTARTTAWLRGRLIGQLLGLGPQRTGAFENGDLVSRVSGNAPDAALAGPSVVMIGAELLPPIGSLILLARIDLWLAVAFLGGVVLVGLVLNAFARHTTDIIASYQRIQGRIAARLTESLGGARTIAAAGTVEREQRRILEPLPELHALGVRTWQVLSRSASQAAIVGPAVLVAVLVAGGLEVVHGRMSPGDLFAASQYAVLGAGLGGLTGVVGELARARAGVHRVGEVLSIEAPSHGRCALPDGPGAVEFRDVSARSGEVVLLDQVSLTVPGGCAAAVVGNSGAGKSVLAAVAGGLRQPDEGQVRLDGVPLQELEHAVLRSAVGCAFERPVLVGGTVAEAIGGSFDPDRDRIRAAARATRADDFISRLPEAYETPLSRAPMSGGEMQRVGLARAWHASRLLVLDDATSSLDMVTEMQISRTLTDWRHESQIPAGRTRLIVTHRASTAARADLVIWLERGRLRAIGSHAALWEDPAYREVFG